MFPDYLSVSDDYGVTHTVYNLLDFNQLMPVRLIKSAVLHLIKTKNPSNKIIVKDYGLSMFTSIS